MKKSIGWIVLIVLLLFVQAYCDLSLPQYTSNIVNVGIQQGGIEDAAAKTIRRESMDRIFLFLTREEQEKVREYYTLDGELWTLQTLDGEEREALVKLLTKPMLAVFMLDAGKRGETEDFDMPVEGLGEMLQMPEGTDAFAALAAMKESAPEQFEKWKEQLYQNFAAMPDTILDQAAVLWVKGEYEAQGVDMQALQNAYLRKTGLWMLGFALVIMAAAIAVTFLASRVAAALARDLREKVFAKVVSFSNAEFDHFSTASLITRSTNDIQQVQMLVVMLLRMVLYAPILGIGGIWRAWQTNPGMSWVIALAVLLILLVVFVLFQVAMPKFRILQQLIDKLNLVSREILQGIPVIRAFSTEKHEEERFDEANRRLMRTNLFVNRCMTFMMPLMMLIMNGITVLIVWRGAYGIDAGSMQVGDLMAFIQYTMMIIMSFLMITMMSIMIPRASVSAVRIHEVLETEVSLKDAEKTEKAAEGKSGIVEFRDVSFAYGNAEENVLSHVTFTARPGGTTAIIGSTGCGKSTLVNLIPRFFDVTEGAVLVDGVDVRRMSQHELHEKIGYVPQKGVLFSGTIASNLRYGREEASKEELLQAAEIAQAKEFIMEKDGQLDAPISQGGTNVSGGQKQRLSIARAIVKKPEIYIFDDSFSALDYKTDVALRNALKKETKDATVILVAQRISTILHAEQIIVLDEGHVAGIGTHRELLKNCDVYYQIAASQLSKEELEHE